MRKLTDHIVEGDSVNHQITVEVRDEPGHGGACHDYAILKPRGHGAGFPLLCSVKFQNGPIKEVGVNGITQEALLAILIDRMRSFQAGAYANKCNESALQALEVALDELQARTRERIARQVEGTHAK